MSRPESLVLKEKKQKRGYGKGGGEGRGGQKEENKSKKQKMRRKKKTRGSRRMEVVGERQGEEERGETEGRQD